MQDSWVNAWRKSTARKKRAQDVGVGGVKEKVIAAQRAGIERIMLPARNHRDLEEIPMETRDRLEFIWLESVEDAIAAGLEREATIEDAPPPPLFAPEPKHAAA